jgi:hypothetical protein
LQVVAPVVHIIQDLPPLVVLLWVELQMPRVVMGLVLQVIPVVAAAVVSMEVHLPALAFPVVLQAAVRLISTVSATLLQELDMFLASAEPEAPQAVQELQTLIMAQPWLALLLEQAAVVPDFMAVTVVLVVLVEAVAALQVILALRQAEQVAVVY